MNEAQRAQQRDEEYKAWRTQADNVCEHGCKKDAFDWAWQAAYAAGAADENEACAKIVQNNLSTECWLPWKDILSAIRARQEQVKVKS